MTDIVERLREENMSAIELEAADEIERLRARNAESMAEGDRLRRQHAEFLEKLQHLIDQDDAAMAKINQKTK